MASEDDKTEDKPKGGKMKIMMVALVMLALGAGGAYGAFAAGLIGSEGEGEPDVPQLVRKGEADPYGGEGGGDQSALVHGEGGSEFRTAYYSFDQGFTSNLADSAGLIQVELAVSTKHDGRVLHWVKSHEIAIRSAILAQLAATPSDDVFDVEGKDRLAKRLTKAINAVLEENEGFGGVDAVHFRGFLVQ